LAAGRHAGPGSSPRKRRPRRFLVAGPLLARFGEALLPPPGGDVIGRRRLDPHLDAFECLGAVHDLEGDIVITAPDGGLRAGNVFMEFRSW